MANISYMPTDGLSYDPSEATYWDPDALHKEVVRVFEVCHGCRMCFKYCDSFPKLFDVIDQHDGDLLAAMEATPTLTDEVMDACFQCKLCEVECPYTPREGHEFLLDFPKLVSRHAAQRTKKQGLAFRHKVLADPDFAGKAARASFGMANAMNKVKVHRWFMEKVLGVHRDKLLPDFAGTTFEKWAAQDGRIKDRGEAVLFQTCYVQNNEPHIGRDACAVMDANQVDMACAKGLGCCGMPAWEKGDLETLRERARHNLDLLMPYVEQGAKVLALNPTCSMVMRMEYPDLVDEADRERAEKLAAATMEISEFLWGLRKEDRFNAVAKSKPEKVAYHAPCHLRAQAKGFKGRDLIKKITGVKPQSTIECCGHDGTYAMTVEGFEPSQKYGRKAFAGMKDAQAEVWVTDCPLAAIQFKQHAGVKPMHPMTVLARAYREDGFEK